MVCVFFCGKHVARYDHLPALAADVQQYIQQHMHSSSESGHSCICRNHRQEVQRHLGNPHHIHVPSWVKKYTDGEEIQDMACVYPKCTVTSHSERIILPTCSLQSAFSDLLNTTQQVRLCGTHYQCLYRQINACSSCASCSAMPKYRQGCYT